MANKKRFFKTNDLSIDKVEVKEKSRTQKKNEVHSLQEMGKQLVKLSISQLERISLPKEIYEAVLLAKKFKTHGAIRRQILHIGTLIRKSDHEPIREGIIKIEKGN